MLILLLVMETAVGFVEEEELEGIGFSGIEGRGEL